MKNGFCRFRFFTAFFSSISFLACFAGSAIAFKLPDTGQTKCYSSSGEISCAGTGQDGVYDINPLSYTDNGDGTVTDSNTGLMWQKCSAGQNNDSACSGDATNYNWFQASGTYETSLNPSSTDVCGSLTTGNYTDWRLPAKKELISLLDYSIPHPGPTIVTSYFPNTKQWGYWSSTVSAYSSGEAWIVFFHYGYVTHETKPSLTYVRCVRGTESARSYTDNGDGTVTDNRTGLMWQQQDDGVGYTWYQASGTHDDTYNQSSKNICAELRTGGHSDWRLPNIKELESLTDDTRYQPAINTDYFHQVASGYWSSTNDAKYPTKAFPVFFTNGNIHFYEKGTYWNVRCVRGNSGTFVSLVRGVNTVNSYPSLQEAYDAALVGDTIRARAQLFTENLAASGDKAVQFSGGYDFDFVMNPGLTTLSGNMVVSGGSVTLENLIIK